MRGEVKQNNKSNITLSVDSPILDEIKKDAEKEGLSHNAKINAILTKHVLFHKHVEAQEGVSMPQKYFKGVVGLLDEKKHLELLNSCAVDETIPSISMHDGIPFTMDDLIKYHFEGVILWSGAYSRFRHYTDNGGYLCLVFEHKFGIKWSRLIGASFSQLVKNMTNRSATFQVLPSTTLIRVNQMISKDN